jgi:hypothetical protein
MAIDQCSSSWERFAGQCRRRTTYVYIQHAGSPQWASCTRAAVDVECILPSISQCLHSYQGQTHACHGSQSQSHPRRPGSPNCACAINRSQSQKRACQINNVTAISARVGHRRPNSLSVRGTRSARRVTYNRVSFTIYLLMTR